MPLQLRRAAQPIIIRSPVVVAVPVVAGDHLLDELRQDPDERGAAGALDVLEGALPGAGEGHLLGPRRQRGERGGGEHLEAGESCRREDEVCSPREQLLAGRHHRDREPHEEGVGGADDVLFGGRELRRDVAGGDHAPVLFVLGDQPCLPAPVDEPHRRRGHRRQVQARGKTVAHLSRSFWRTRSSLHEVNLLLQVQY
ncbi:hypothetical protein PR202_gb03732 [Eleusine coracana subsp. coracana]|uniref:Uncharacterized protein n=1 Tax=Eleusine coracana subsp. coracana TaxID=191504 RepID=A0AAV5E2R2_ELECO|nr:hypothetical protein PR202_gb03732 [Eleusine coracana subsp. coracana]